MFLTRKTLLAFGCVSLLHSMPIFANDEINNVASVNFTEQVLGTVRQQESVNLLTRIAAKSAFELTLENADKSSDWSKFKKDVVKALGNGTLEEIAPLSSDAHIATKHADAVLPVAIKKLYVNDQNKWYVKTDKENLQNAAVAIFKKETDKGFFINKDYGNLRTPEDVVFFIVDALTEALNDDTSKSIIKKNSKDEIDTKRISKEILGNKVLTPLIMAWMGDEAVKSIVKSKNKNVLKAFSGLLRDHLVSKVIKNMLGLS